MGTNRRLLLSAAFFVALPMACGGSSPSDMSTGAAGSTAGQGAAGTSGAAGTGGTGAAGTQGSAGATGAAGSGGSPDAAGASGAAGSGGSAGSSGAAGSGGSSGAAGTTGAGGGAGKDGGATDGGGSDAAIPTAKFSFFVTSLKALKDLSKSDQGFGGDLRFGETGAGAGLRGADKICATIAERSMAGAGKKPWRAFLSAVAGEDGKQVNAIDRVGEGPWYDRLGRTLALTKADLLFDRPRNADPAIANDFPNEDGVPNHTPDPTMGAVDNHDFLTGSNNLGKLYSATATCADWTGAKGTEGKPRVGHTWPRGGGGGGGGSGVNWMSALDESGCSPGVNLIEMGGPLKGSTTVGSGGGYGGFYCFSLVP
jgi:hypothetical protein